MAEAIGAADAAANRTLSASRTLWSRRCAVGPVGCGLGKIKEAGKDMNKL